MSAVEGHILEDVNKCVLALQQRDTDMFDRTAGAIRGRCSRVCNVVAAEVLNFAAGPYTDRVMETVIELRDRSKALYYRRRNKVTLLSNVERFVQHVAACQQQHTSASERKHEALICQKNA